jgi:hypothetical protein
LSQACLPIPPQGLIHGIWGVSAQILYITYPIIY